VVYRTGIKLNLLLIAVSIYIAGFVAGVLLNGAFPGLSDQLHDEMVESLRDEFADIDSFGGIYLKLFWHNVSRSALMVFAGIVFGILPVFMLALNGLLLGLVLARFDSPVVLFFTSVLPHGLFEFPAIFIAGAMGLLLGQDAISLVRYWMRGEGEASTRILVKDLKSVAPSFILVGVFLAIAAAIETLLILVSA
jgi:stage II sporulation protein M